MPGRRGDERMKDMWKGTGTRSAGAAVLVVVALGLPSTWAGAPEDAVRGGQGTRFAAHEALPAGDAETLAWTYFAALEIPGVRSLGAAGRRGLLEAATARHRDRLADRGPDAASGRRYVERLAGSEAGRGHPASVAKACARHGLLDGACAAHAGYARRAALLEEMLAAGRLTPAELEAELSGPGRRAAPSGFAAWTEPDSPGDRDGLPGGPPAEVAALYHSALALPGVADWPASRRTELLDAATARHRERLVDGRPAVPAADRLAYVSRLAASPLGMSRPGVVRQTCAQFGLGGGGCAAHRGYVRRTLVLEEMLARGHLTLAELETELAGAPRPGRDGGTAVGGRGTSG